MGALSAEPLRGRQGLRSLKRLARAGASIDAAPALRLQSQAIALALLDRSIKFKHHRLALVRLKEAFELGAVVDTEQWTYCKGVLALVQDSALRAYFEIGANRPRLYATMLAAQSLGAIPIPLYQDAVATECVFRSSQTDSEKAPLTLASAGSNRDG